MDFKIIKVGICGFGKAVEEFHLPAIRHTSEFKITSIFDITPLRLDKAITETEAEVYSDYGDFLKSGVDLVIIATPSNSHSDYAIKAIDAGIGVVIEKPMALTSRDCDRIIKEARARKVFLTVHHNRRWDGDFLAVKEIVKSGLLGNIKFLASRVMNYGPLLGYSVPEFDTGWRYKKGFGGGQLYDFGAHLIDQTLDLIEEKPVDIKCDLKKELWSNETDTHFKLDLEFKSGIKAELIASQISKESLPRWEIQGETGSLLCNTFSGPIKVTRHGQEEAIAVQKHQYNKFYENLYLALTKGAKLEVKPEQARDVVEVIEKAYKAAPSSSLA